MAIEIKNYYVACLSGGKDSLYMFRHILHNLDKYPLDAVVHFKLPYDYPFVENVISEVKRGCEKIGIPVYIIEPRKDFHEQLKKYGFPTGRTRWCNALKMDCVKQFRRMFKDVYNVKQYIGFCYDEHKRFKDDIYPLAEAGIYERTIWEWARNNPIFNDFYKYNYRQGCMYCPMQQTRTTKYNSIYYPEFYERYMKWAEDTENIFNNSSWQGNPKYNTKYRRKKVAEMELKELTEWKDRRGN